MTQDQFEYLVKVASAAADYKMHNVERMLVSPSVLLVPTRRERSNIVKSAARLAYLTKDSGSRKAEFSLSKKSQVEDTSMIPGDRPELPADLGAQVETGGAPLIGDAPPASASDPYAPLIAGGDVNSSSDNDSSVPAEVRQFLGNKVIELKKLVQDISTHAWRINLSEPDTMRVVKEALKTISNKVADVPIQGVIDRIDDYLDEVGRSSRSKDSGDKKPKPAPGDGAEGPSARGVSPGPSSPAAPTAVEALPKESNLKTCSVVVTNPKSSYYGMVGHAFRKDLNSLRVPVVFDDGSEEILCQFHLRPR